MNDVADYFFQRLAVLFIHGKQEERKHGDDHADCRAAVADLRFQQEKQRNTDRHTRTEAYELALSQVQYNLSFNCGQVFGDWNICHNVTSNSICCI